MRNSPIKRILLWCPTGAGLHYGGAGTNAYRLYKSALPDGIQVTLACACPEQEDYSIFSEIVQIHRGSSQSHLSHLIFMCRAKQWLRMNARHFDVFHGIDIFDNTIRPAIWAEQYGLSAVVKPAIYGAGLTTSKGIRRLLKLPEKRRELISQLSGVVAISAEIEKEMLSYGVPHEIVKRIPNGVDAERFKPVSDERRGQLRESFGWPADTFIVLFVGSITDRKRPDWITSAVKPLMDQHPNLRVVFVGPGRGGDYKSVLQEEVALQSWSNRIEFLGLREDVENVYQAADVFCLPSMNEGMPNSVLEAMASGLPCLVTPVSGSKELVVDGSNGFHIDGPDAIRFRISEYMNKPELAIRQGEAARQLVLDKYSTVRVFAEHLKLFESVVNT
ncbi:glycosyltransferase family 4 protein [bacterium]|nr:glycosyltransferase family 4 protein [bacterium]